MGIRCRCSRIEKQQGSKLLLRMFDGIFDFENRKASMDPLKYTINNPKIINNYL